MWQRRRSPRLLGLVLALCAILAGCSVTKSDPAPTSTPPSVSAAPDLTQLVEQHIALRPDQLGNVRAVLVNVDGANRVELYREGFSADDHEHVWSVTKSVVSTLIGIAVGEGLIADLDAPLSETLPRYRSSMTAESATITLRQLLTMTSGLAYGPPDERTGRDDFGTRDLIPWTLRKGLEYDVGKQFHYSNLSAHVAVAVLAEALKRHPDLRTVLGFARARLFDPLGIDTHPAYTRPYQDTSADFDRAGFGWSTIGALPLGALGLRLTAPDLLKLGQLYLDDGRWQGRRVLPEGWVDQVTTPSPLADDYGLMWWLDVQLGVANYSARGSESQLIVVIPDRRAVIVVLCATGTTTPVNERDANLLIDNVIIPLL